MDRWKITYETRKEVAMRTIRCAGRFLLCVGIAIGIAMVVGIAAPPFVTGLVAFVLGAVASCAALAWCEESGDI